MPIWLTLILALPQILKFVKEIFDLWKSLKAVPVQNKAVAAQDFKETLACVKSATDDAVKKDLLAGLKERLDDHKRP